jgi:hypothetical protein
MPRTSDFIRFIVAGPRRHRDTDRGKRLRAERSKLKMCSEWNRQARPCVDRDDLFA